MTRRNQPVEPIPCGTSVDRSRAHDDGDRGFILVTFGLLLIPIMVFTALAVDVSSWYSRATELQRSADAAALAGVVWMPNFSKSTTDANTVLAKNGFTNGGNIATSTSVGTQSANAFQVCVSDNKVRQFFGMVFASPTKMTRCATAMYNTPLQLGSPLNYFGGNNSSLMQYVPGPVPPGAYVDAPAAAAFGSDKYCWVRSGATTVGFWDRTSSGNWAPDQWRFWTWPGNSLTGSHPLCNSPAPAIPDSPTYAQGSGATRCSVPGGTGTWFKNGSGTFPVNWYYGTSANPSLPACTYAGYQDSPIPTQKSPNFWAAIEGYTNNHANGDAYSTSGAQHRNTGYWYAVDIPASGLTNPVSVQAWDLNSNCKLTCRTAMGDDSGPRVRMVVYKAGALKFDMTQITAIAGCDTGWISSGTSATYSARWAQICSIGSAQAGDRYYINVISNDGTNGMSDGGYNGYALRTVAGTFPAACMDVMPVGNVACYGTGTQPALSAYGDMEMYNGIGQGTPTQFYLANVIPNYAGKTLQIDLFDPGDGGSGTNSWMTVMGPSTSSTSGQKLPASACTVQTRPYGNNSSWTTQSLSNGPNSTYNNTCTFQTTNNGDNSFGQDNWVRITIPLPSDYGPTGGANWTKCNPNVTDPVNNVGSCWWQMSYFVTGSNLSDYTTWSASVVGDPVHLVQ